MDELPFLLTDMLASEYGWSMQYVLESLYFDEVQKLLPFIRRRQISEYKMQLMIIENPHRKEPGVLWDMLDQQDNSYIEHEELDRSGFDSLRKRVATGGGLVVK